MLMIEMMLIHVKDLKSDQSRMIDAYPEENKLIQDNFELLG